MSKTYRPYEADAVIRGQKKSKRKIVQMKQRHTAKGRIYQQELREQN